MEIKLTDEQIEKARKAYFGASPICRELSLNGLLAAAPYLQAPWAMPTEEEINTLRRFTLSDTLTFINAYRITMLSEFIAARNATLKPKPTEARLDDQAAKKWEEMANQAEQNADYYRSLVYQIGKHFGIEAYTSDDGSVQQNILCEKVPELVAEFIAKHAPVDPAVKAVNAILNNPHTAATRAEVLVAAVREADAKATQYFGRLERKAKKP